MCVLAKKAAVVLSCPPRFRWRTRDAGTRQLRMCRNRESELLTNWRVGCRVECRWKASNSYESEY